MQNRTGNLQMWTKEEYMRGKKNTRACFETIQTTLAETTLDDDHEVSRNTFSHLASCGQNIQSAEWIRKAIDVHRS
jgi:hypothetical protein